jgi:hypothetical protein
MPLQALEVAFLVIGRPGPVLPASFSWVRRNSLSLKSLFLTSG